MLWRDVSGLPLAVPGLIRLNSISRNCGLVSILNFVLVGLRPSDNAVAVLESGDGKRSLATFSIVLFIFFFRIWKRARARFGFAWNPLYIDCVGNPSTISRDCGLSDC